MKNTVTFLLTALIGLSGMACGADSSGVKAVAKKPKTAKTAVKKTAAKADTLKPTEVKLPKLVDLGAKKCVPCKLMAPILEDLGRDFKGKMDVVFIDVWENSGAGNQYKIRVIPTQIFFAPDGKELFRHEGFYSREDILKKWKELGYDFNAAPEKEKKP
ncbi:MAG: thioredoxin family protein [Candidatus Edwardsbacteria bacterium]|nr:thioredoxin family protein [Candidatus Edwardsbacteria bacterium]